MLSCIFRLDVAFLRSQLRILRFVTAAAALAIKTFQSVNDRGRPLTLLGKTKSLLMFYSTRYLETDEETFEHIEDCFGQVYENFDKIRDLAVRHKVEYLVNPRYRFVEDELLMLVYHYSAKYLIEKYGLALTYVLAWGQRRFSKSFSGTRCKGSGVIQGARGRFCGSL